MGQLDNVQRKLGGDVADGEGGYATARQLFEFAVTERLAADGAAGTTIAATKFWTNPFPFSVELVEFSVNPDAAVTGDTTNHGTITMTVDDGANGAPATGAEITTDTDAPGEGNWSQDVKETGRRTVANVRVAPGANVFYTQTKGGTGVQFPARVIACRFAKL
jgi:hypothetical protein